MTRMTISEAELARACKEAPIGVEWIALDGTVLWANDAAAQLPCETRRSAALGPIFATLIERVRGGEQTVSATAQVCGDDEPAKYVAIDARGEWRAGVLSGLRCFIRDVTECRNAENAIARADAAALDALRLKSEFLANLSHELRTPLNGVIGFTHLALDTVLDGEQHEYLEGVRTCANDLLALIDDLLDLSSLDAGTRTEEPAPLELRALIETEVRRVAAAAEAKGLDLVCDVRPELPARAVGDADALRRVLSHLLDNAVKFTAHGEVVVRASVEGTSRNGKSMLHVAVSDTGIGIPEDRQRSITERFVQVDGSSTRTYGGLGIGLAIAHELVTMMGGRLWLESRLGQGSTFHFMIAMTPTESGFVPLALRNVFSGCSALVVMPAGSGRRVLTEALLRYGIAPRCVSDALDAAAAFERGAAGSGDLDLIVVDDRVSNASALLDRLSVAGSPPLLILTADGPQAASTAAQYANTAVLQRPVTDDALREPLATSLGKSAVSRAAVATANGERRRRGPLHVLVAEDDAGSRLIAARCLERRGHTVCAVENGRQALNELARDQFDVVVMDVQMPELNGLETASAIRHGACTRDRQLPIVALTGHAMAADRKRCLASGMDAYLTKPIDTATLVTTVENLGRVAG